MLTSQSSPLSLIVNPDFMLYFYSLIIGTYSTGRGSVGFADSTKSILTFMDTRFLKNYAIKGGLFFSH
jgi:hypothetical protein